MGYIDDVRKTWARLHLSAKLIVTIVAIVALPVAIVASIYIGRETGVLRRSASERIAAAVEAEAAGLANRLSIMRNAAYLMAIEVPFVELTESQTSDSSEQTAVIRARFTAASRTIRFLVEDMEEVRLFYGETGLSNALPFARYVRDLPSHPFFKPLIIRPDVREHWVFDHTGGGLEQIFSAGRLVSLFLSVSSNPPIVLEISALTSRIFQKVRENVVSEMFWVAELPDGSFILPDEPARYAASSIDRSQIPELLKGIDKGIRGSVIKIVGGAEAEIHYVYLPASEIFLYAIARTDEAVNRMVVFRNGTLVGVLLALVAVSAMVSLIVRTNLKRLDHVVVAIRSLEAGDLEVVVPIEGEDEIAELAVHFQRLVERINFLVYEHSRREAAKIEARTRALLAQINAHFIYNILESVKMRAYVGGVRDIPDAVGSLARMLRYGMSWERQFVCLDEELDNVADFAELINFRFDFHIELKIQIPDAARAVTVLKMLLQPLVENSAKYAMAAKRETVTVIVRATVGDGFLDVVVEDDGPGIPTGKVESINRDLAAAGRTYSEPSPSSSALPGTYGALADDGTVPRRTEGIGLINIAERIFLYHGPESWIRLDNRPSGTKVRLRLPCQGTERSLA
jgi:two-component system sensor histidine kinase YesM